MTVTLLFLFVLSFEPSCFDGSTEGEPSNRREFFSAPRFLVNVTFRQRAIFSTHLLFKKK
jgi:hypothetical protein